MAGKFQKQEADEDLFLCTSCSKELSNPKLLPCLHRCCLDCLLHIKETSQGDFIECPACTYRCRIPKSGVDGFQSDLHVAAKIRLRHLPKTLEEKGTQVCECCTERSLVTAYCSKCEVYLCKQCHNLHLQEKEYEGHKQHLCDMMEQRIAPEKPACCDRPPYTCEHHPEEEAIRCCYTCKHVLVCASCSNTHHKGHYVLSVTDSGKMERDRLNSKLLEINRNESRITNIQDRVEMVRKELNKNVLGKNDQLKVQYERELKKLEQMVEKQGLRLKHKISNLEKRRDEECKDIKLMTDKKMQILLEECECLITEKKKQYSEKIKVIKETHKLEEENMKESLMESLQKNLSYLKTVVEARMQNNEEKLDEALKFADDTQKRYENFKYTASNLLATEDNCMYSQYLPGITLASQHLIKDVEKEFPYLESLSDFDVEDLQDFSNFKTITKENTVVVSIQGTNAKGLAIDGITRSSDGGMVITGCATKEYSYLSVINQQGQVIRHENFERLNAFPTFPYRFCSFFSEFLVATVCIPDEVGIYDVRDGTYRSRKVSRNIATWTLSRHVYCVTTDPVNSHIIVGSNSREVYVFDDQLNYVRTIQLPDVIRHSRDIAVHGSNLVICDYCGRSSYAVALEGSAGKLMYTFRQPDSKDGTWEPLSVCTDANNIIYMIWIHTIPGEVKRYLSQYNQDGDDLMAVIPIDGDSRCLSTFEEDGSEKLVVATLKSGKFFFVNREYSKYHLIV